MTTVNAGVWLRVSTGEQETGNQRPELEQFAAHHGYTITRTYELDDSAWNGGKDGGLYKTRLAEAMDDAWAGKFSVLIVWALDRITREGAEGALRVIRQFRERGCTVVSLKESWLNASPEVQDVLVAFAGWMAQQESQRRSLRIKAGIERRKLEDPDFRPGRQPGAVDNPGRPRRRSGYVAAWEPGGTRRERQAKA